MRRTALIAPAILLVLLAQLPGLGENGKSVRQELFNAVRQPNSDFKAIRGTGQQAPAPAAVDKAAVQATEEKKKGAVQRLFDVIKKPWQDFKPIYGDGTGEGEANTSGEDASRETAEQNGAGGGSSDGNVGDTSGKRIGFDDNRPKGANGDGSNDGHEDEAKDPDPAPPGGGNTASGGTAGGKPGQAQAFDKWWPMCLFMDSYIDKAAGNATVKRLVDEVAQNCQVNLVIFPITVRAGSYPQNPEAYEVVNQMQQRACDAVGKVGNATRASTSICVAGDRFSEEMCKSYTEDPTTGKKTYSDTAGCAQLQAGVKTDFAQQIYGDYDHDPKNADAPNGEKAYQARKKQIEDHMKGMTNSAGGQAAPSIEDVNMCTADIVGHEALGHSQFGHPNGSGDGHGIGFHKEGDGTDRPWTAEGCAAMRKNAFDNTDKRWKWEPNRKNYYQKEERPDKQYNLASDPPLFGPRKSPPKQGPATKPPPSRVTDTGGPRVDFQDGAPKALPKSQPIPSSKVTPPSAPSPAGNTAAKDPSEDFTRHKSKSGGSVTQSLVDAVRPDGGSHDSESTPADPPQSPLPAPSSPPVSSGNRVGFDDNAKKSRVGSSVPSQPRTNTSSPGQNSSYGDGDGESYSESTPSAPADASPPSNGSYSTRGGSIGFADGAPKTMPGLSLGGSGRGSTSSGTSRETEAEGDGNGSAGSDKSSVTRRGSERDDESEDEDGFFRKDGERKPSSTKRQDRRRTRGDNSPRRSQ